MNTHMYENAFATQAKLATLYARGIELVGPGIGKARVRRVAMARFSPVDEIVEAICKKLGVRKAASAYGLRFCVIEHGFHIRYRGENMRTG